MRFTRNTHLITIQSFASTGDSAGGQPRTYTDFASMYLSVRYQSASERLEGDRNVETKKALFKGRFDSDSEGITAKMRLVFDGSNWDITGVVYFGRDETIEITAIEKDG